MSTCTFCNAKLTAGTIDHTFIFDEECVEVQIPAQLCNACGESYVDGPDFEKAEIAAEKKVSRNEETL